MSFPTRRVLIWGLPISGAILVTGFLFFIYAGNDKSDLAVAASSTGKVSPETASFENNFYDYLAQSLQEIFVSGGNSAVLSEKVGQLTSEGIGMIDEFVAQQKREGKTISDPDYHRLNQLRFYVYSSIAIDEAKTRSILDQLPNNNNKLSLIYTYIETFAKETSRPQTSETVFMNFINDQRHWAEPLEKNYSEKVQTLKFKADPINKALPNHLAKYKSTEGKSLDLRDFRGKFVLVDFWATWCLPCIAELPYLQEAYQKYNSKGFEIISISLDNNDEAFKNFIADRKIPWIQYYDGKGFRSDLVREYGVTGIPTLYLLDREGKTIMGNMSGEQLLKILKSMLNS